MSNHVAVKLSRISKTYELHHEKPTFVENMLKLGRTETFVAINNLSLTINRGERVGIIGPNGSGKTTLLKLIAGISQPSNGKVTTYGKVVSLIDLEAGFHPDLTGEENIFLNGLILGMTMPEIKTVFEKIVAFADIGKFIDAPLHTYSQGMKLRLGFAVAIHSEPDTLILDEGMVVGDENFQTKTRQVMRALFKSGKTIIMVTQWKEYLKKNANRIVIMNQGKIVADGTTKLLKLIA